MFDFFTKKRATPPTNELEAMIQELEIHLKNIFWTKKQLQAKKSLESLLSKLKVALTDYNTSKNWLALKDVWESEVNNNIIFTTHAGIFGSILDLLNKIAEFFHKNWFQTNITIKSKQIENLFGRMLIIGAQKDSPLDCKRFDEYAKKNNLIWRGQQNYFKYNDDPFEVEYSADYSKPEVFNALIQRLIQHADSSLRAYIELELPAEKRIDCFMIDQCVLNFFIPDHYKEKIRLPMLKMPNNYVFDPKDASLRSEIIKRGGYDLFFKKIKEMIFTLLIERFMEKLRPNGTLIVDSKFKDDNSNINMDILNKYFSIKGTNMHEVAPELAGWGTEDFMIFRGFAARTLQTQPESLQVNADQILPISNSPRHPERSEGSPSDTSTTLVY